MALFKGSSVVGAISGKTGGIVFSRNRGGAYLKNFKMPVNPNTTRQQEVRASFGLLASSWRDLTTSDQKAWIEAAPLYPYSNRLGDTRIYSGQQLYVSLNQNLSNVAQPILSTPLVPQTFTKGMEGYVLSKDGLADKITVSSTGSAEEILIVTATPALSPGINSPGSSIFRQVGVFFDTTVLLEYDFTTGYTAIFGPNQPGAKVFTRAYLVNTKTGQKISIGQASTISV